MDHKKVVVVMSSPDPKKGSVRFNAPEGKDRSITTNIYIDREAAGKLLGVSLDEVQSIQVTIEVKELK